MWTSLFLRAVSQPPAHVYTGHNSLEPLSLPLPPAAGRRDSPLLPMRGTEYPCKHPLHIPAVGTSSSSSTEDGVSTTHWHPARAPEAMIRSQRRQPESQGSTAPGASWERTHPQQNRGSRCLPASPAVLRLLIKCPFYPQFSQCQADRLHKVNWSRGWGVVSVSSGVWPEASKEQRRGAGNKSPDLSNTHRPGTWIASPQEPWATPSEARPRDDVTQVTTAGRGGRGRGSTTVAGSAPRPGPLLPERPRHITLVSSTHICKRHRIYPLRGSRGPGTSSSLFVPDPQLSKSDVVAAAEEGTDSLGLSIWPWIPGQARQSPLHTQVAEFSSSCVQPSRLHLQTTDQDSS